MPPYVSPEAKDLMRKLLKVCIKQYYFYYEYIYFITILLSINTNNVITNFSI